MADTTRAGSPQRASRTLNRCSSSVARAPASTARGRKGTQLPLGEVLTFYGTFADGNLFGVRRARGVGDESAAALLISYEHERVHSPSSPTSHVHASGEEQRREREVTGQRSGNAKKPPSEMFRSAEDKTPKPERARAARENVVGVAGPVPILSVCLSVCEHEQTARRTRIHS